MFNWPSSTNGKIKYTHSLMRISGIHCQCKLVYTDIQLEPFFCHFMAVLLRLSYKSGVACHNDGFSLNACVKLVYIDGASH